MTRDPNIPNTDVWVGSTNIKLVTIVLQLGQGYLSAKRPIERLIPYSKVEAVLFWSPKFFLGWGIVTHTFADSSFDRPSLPLGLKLEEDLAQGSGVRGAHCESLADRRGALLSRWETAEFMKGRWGEATNARLCLTHFEVTLPQQ